MSSVPEGRAANQPLGAQTLTPPMGALLPGACSEHLIDAFAGEFGAANLRAIESWRASFSAPEWRGASMRSANGSPRSSASVRYASPGSRPVRAVISAESSAGVMPSLSVLQAPPSIRLNDAPALSSPPNPRSPDRSPATNHLNPTGTSYSRRSSRAVDPVDHRAAHDGLADAGRGLPQRAVPEQIIDGHGQSNDSAAANRRWRSRCRAGRGRCRRRRRRRTCPSGR